LRYADLSSADLRSADLRYADLSSADLRSADLRYADLSSADLRSANLSSADLRSANLSSADLRSANLSSANLSETKGILFASEYLEKNFEFLPDGSMVVYKTFGRHYPAPEHWKIEPGSVIESPCNPDRCTDCGSGVNVAVRCWSDFGNGDLWKCIIKPQWLGGVVVPFGTDGKIRAEKVQLVEIIERD
jgi:hypothetical protein